jgi:signal transduction histidine kinase
MKLPPKRKKGTNGRASASSAARLRALESELAREQKARARLEKQLEATRDGSGDRLESLARFLLDSIEDENFTGQFFNAAIDDLPDGAALRCWLEEGGCPNGRTDGKSLGERMRTCTECDAFQDVAPDPFTRLAELVNSVLFLLRRKHEHLSETRHQLVQSEKLAGLGELAAGLAHEINTPTGIILARLDCMNFDQDHHLPSGLRDDLKVIRRHAERLCRITRSLTAFARRHKIEKREVVLQDLLREVLEITERIVERSKVKIVVEMPGVPMKAFADATMIQQVFMNIMLNARDAMPSGGMLTVRGLPARDEWVIEFEDTGIGMDEYVRERVFDPFFTTKEARGTGLGLSVSYGIVKDHNGRIEVESRPGEGALFRVALPRLQGTTQDARR